MNLAWWMIALAVAGADDQKLGTPPPTSGVISVAAAAKIKDAEKPDPWPLDLATATHIAFDNSEHFRVVEFGVSGLGAYFPLHTYGPLTIARLDAKVPLAKFKANAMALVRSVEQAYWNLARAQVALKSKKQVVRATQELHDAEQAKLTCRGSVTDVAEAAERLDQFSKELEGLTADVEAAERSLHKVLGLPPADNRRIIATTKPIEEPIAFDWDTSIEEMSQEQPENIEQQAIGRLAELNLFLARYQVIPLMDADTQRQFRGLGLLLDSTEAVSLGQFRKALRPQISSSLCAEGIDPFGDVYMDSLTWHRYLANITPIGFGRSPLANTRRAQYVLLRTRACQRQVFEQTAHSLSRCFVEVDETLEQYVVAKRLKAAAVNRLAVQRVSYEEGRITLDRWLDAMDMNAQAIAAEARHQGAYNNALAALSEAKGTLLADREITIAESPKRVPPIAAKMTEPVSIGFEPPKRGDTVK